MRDCCSCAIVLLCMYHTPLFIGYRSPEFRPEPLLESRHPAGGGTGEGLEKAGNHLAYPIRRGSNLLVFILNSMH